MGLFIAVRPTVEREVGAVYSQLCAGAASHLVCETQLGLVSHSLLRTEPETLEVLLAETWAGRLWTSRISSLQHLAMPSCDYAHLTLKDGRMGQFQAGSRLARLTHK